MDDPESGQVEREAEPDARIDDADRAEPDEERVRALVPARQRALAPADSFRAYLREIRAYPPLTREEEQRLVRLYRGTGDREALLRLVTANLRLVVRIALSYRRSARMFLDLVQEGNLGLLQAIERFDPEVGVRLPTYAAWWIRAYILKFLLDNVRQVRVGTTNARRKLLRNLRREQQKLEAEGFDAGPRLLAERFGVSEEDVRDVQQALESHDLELDAPVVDGEKERRVDTLASAAPSVEEEIARRELREKVEAAIAVFRETLGERDRMLLDRRILAEDPVTLQAIGERFGTTREAVRQAEVKLMGRLKEHLRNDLGDLGSIRLGPD